LHFGKSRAHPRLFVCRLLKLSVWDRSDRNARDQQIASALPSERRCRFQPLIDLRAQQAYTAICDHWCRRLVVLMREGSSGLIARHNLCGVRAN
jgi:hypothetical protein